MYAPYLAGCASLDKKPHGKGLVHVTTEQGNEQVEGLGAVDVQPSASPLTSEEKKAHIQLTRSLMKRAGPP